jgi:hypothetical protein
MGYQSKWQPSLAMIVYKPAFREPPVRQSVLVKCQQRKEQTQKPYRRTVGEKSRFHSLARKKAKKKRTLVLWPVYNNLAARGVQVLPSGYDERGCFTCWTNPFVKQGSSTTQNAFALTGEPG